MKLHGFCFSLVNHHRSLKQRQLHALLFLFRNGCHIAVPVRLDGYRAELDELLISPIVLLVPAEHRRDRQRLYEFTFREVEEAAE